MPGDDPRAYAASTTGERLYQGEILSNIIERPVRWVSRSDAGDEFGFDEIVQPYVVVLNQDCDLQQDAAARAEHAMDEAKRQKAMLPAVLLVVASEFDNATDFGGSDIKRRARQNKDERYQFLSAVPATHDAAGEGVSALVLDFKRFFTYRTEELLGAIARGESRRRARLVTPYAEHLSSRFAYFIQRIGLPRDHHDLVAERQPVQS